jgi:hypothetical protein
LTDRKSSYILSGMTPEHIERLGASAARQAAADVAFRHGTRLEDLESAIVGILMLALEDCTPELSRDKRASLFNNDDE